MAIKKQYLNIYSMRDSRNITDREFFGLRTIIKCDKIKLFPVDFNFTLLYILFGR